MTGAVDPVASVLDLLAGREPTLGSGRLVCIDGPAGSGKTTLAAAVAGATRAPVVHLDDLYEGWDGLDGLDAQLRALLRPLAAGRPGSYRRYDWDAEAFAETVEVAPAPLLVVEGVGAGASGHRELVTVLVWVEAPRALRLRRGLERDGHHLREKWWAWQATEDRHHVAHATRARADLVVDTAAAV